MMRHLATDAQPPEYLDGLNTPQRDAVETIDGPVLVLAGAGTGKTRALTARLAHLIATGRAYPGEILAVTFTNKAAREMQHRVGQMIGGAVEGMTWLGTFHSVSARMLRRHAELVGLTGSFSILDTDDQIRAIKQVLTLANLDEKRWPARVLAGIIDRWKNRGWTPDQVPPAEAGSFADGKAISLYQAYQDRLKTVNACDFGDLLLHTLSILQHHPDVLEQYQRRFKYIMVDEYQDTNVCQYLWLRLLAQSRKNICCVGDDDQSIYSWRGAEVANILRFEQDFPGAHVIRLEQNYRSTPEILGAASGLIAANQSRLGKTLWTDAPSGQPLEVVSVWDGAEEARVIGERIESGMVRGESLGDMAVLVRASFQTREFEDRFLTLGLPYRIVGGFRFYERAEIRDAMAYLRLIRQPDDDLAFERIVNTPKRGLGDKTIQKLHTLARARSLPLVRTAAELSATDELPPAARRALSGLLADLVRWRDGLSTLHHAALARTVLDESGYTAMLQADKSPEASGRLENLVELTRAMEDFESLAGFLDHVSLVMENEEQRDGPKVTVMTLHAAKGLEFPTVFLAGWEEGLFPNQRALDEGGLASLEEERRLAYVGITRARRTAVITHAANRRVYGQWQSCLPSRFLAELPQRYVRQSTTMAGQTRLWSAMPAVDPVARPVRLDSHGPGWTRAGGQDAMRARAATISAPARIAARVDLAVGQRVFHQKFGYGRITAIDGDKLDIAFESAGTKRVIASFVTPA